ncbi:MAG: hypothetical protein IPJ85_01580 [Flavobacteriales bacterium]|nr:hypothetical protein [Flavobacteriales bacterium]
MSSRFLSLAFALAVSCTALLVRAQQPFVWDDAPAWNSTWEEGRTIDSEVLTDELSIRIRNVKPEFLALFFERRKVVRFAAQEDIKRYGPIVLPESLDPPYDVLGKPWERRETRPYPMLFNMRVDHFAARVIRPDGSWDELPVDTRGAKGFLGNPVAYQATMSITHYPVGIMPGDVVEYRWKYMLPYDSNAPHTQGARGLQWMGNWSRFTNWRVFFNGPLPIREQRIELRYHAKHGIILGGAAPERIERQGDERTALWRNGQLAGAMDEVNGDQARTLPHIVVTWMPDDLRYWRRERLSNLPIPQQPWLQVVRLREAKAEWYRRVALKKIPDRQNTLVKRFITRTCTGIHDTLSARRVEALHESIARDFVYSNDRDWYNNIDNSLERIGDQVEGKRLRDISRYNMYSKLIQMQRLPYVTTYVLDKRSGALNDRFTTPMWETEWLFGVRDGDEMLWMHPKRQRHGWFANELPFYWEGTMALLVDRQRLLEDDPRPPLFVELPTGEPSANVRAIEHQLRVDLEQPDSEGEARIFLSGQFSTLGRAAFLGGKRDSTVMPAYGHTLEQVQGVRARRIGEHELSDDPPFRYREQQALTLPGFRVKEEGGLFAFDLRGFIAHAVPVGFAAQGRDLPFHWDFQQSDRFIIEIAFAQPVEVMDLTQLQGAWESPSARYTLEATLIDAKHLRIESRLDVLRPVEEVSAALALGELIRAVHEPERVLRVRLPSAMEP